MGTVIADMSTSIDGFVAGADDLPYPPHPRAGAPRTGGGGTVKRIARRVLAVGAGLAVIVVLSNGADTVLELTGVYPSIDEQRRTGFDVPWMLATGLAYRAVFAAVGGYVTARLAPARPVAHVAAPLVVGCLLGLAGLAAAAGVTPLWFSLAVLVVTPVAVWVGGRFHGARRRRHDLVGA